MPQIAVINESTAISDADVRKMIPAFDQQWNKDLQPVWGVDCHLQLYSKRTDAAGRQLVVRIFG
jgi:hypothetical protein